MKESIFTWLIIAAFTATLLWQNGEVFFNPTDVDHYGELYSQSQYVLGEKSSQKIDDSTLYTYAGYAYLRGEDPTTINFEHPPLGKYVFGISYQLFGNAFFINLAIYLGILIFTHQLAKKVLLTDWLATASVILVGGLAIMRAHTTQGLLDLQQLLLTLGFFITLFSQHRRKYSIASLLIGLIASVKYPFPLLTIFIAVFLYWSFQEKQIKKALFSLPLVVIVYLLSYSVYFWHHPNPWDFLQFEWYRFRWWTGERTIPKFLIFQMLFTGKFAGWWAPNAIEQEKSWSLFWPFSFLSQLLLIPIFWKKLDKKVKLLFIYTNGLLILYAFSSASYGRYLIQLLPFWIILGLWGGERLLRRTKKSSLNPIGLIVQSKQHRQVNQQKQTK